MEHLDHLGEPRKLALQRPTAKPRASATNIQTIRVKNGLPPLETVYEKVDYVTNYPLNLINDQRDCSGCTGWSAAGSSMRMRYIRGRKFLRLSGAAIYAQINGGSDNGSNILDAMNVLESTGTCLESDMDYPKIYKEQIPVNSLIYREAVPITLGSAQECATALMMGMLPQVPIMVWSSWENFVDGIAQTYKKEAYGNHSVYLAGLEEVKGRWVFRLVNSWTPNWGPFKNGTCFIEMGAVDNCAIGEQSYAHAA